MHEPAIHLADWLDRARVQSLGASHVEIQTFVIDRMARSVVFQHPPSCIEWPETELGASPRLKASLAIKPFAWERISSPVIFRIGVRTLDGTESAVLEELVDPRSNKGHRVWIPIDVSLETWSGQKVRLVFETRGHVEPVSYGWAGWGAPLLSDASLAVQPKRPAHHLTEFKPENRKPDIILVTCDALRADHVGGYGAPAGATPHVDAFAADAVRVTQARSASDATLSSFASLLTGRLPHETGVLAEWGNFPEHLPSLPVMLAGAGYHTVLASSERELGVPGAGLARLFAESIPCLGNPSQHSSMTVRRLSAHLRSRDAAQPVFAWMQLFEPHPPVLPEADFLPAFAGDPSQPHLPEAVRAIHAMETSLDLAICQPALAEGRVPSALLQRLEDTVRVLIGDLTQGPDLASHLEALGSRARRGMGKPAFLRWLAHELAQVRASGGRGSSALLSWLRELGALLTEMETDMLGWLAGVQDFRYPQALYAAAVKSADQAFGSLIATLRDLGRYENAVIIFTSPHGELFHLPPLTLEHHVLHESVLRVPLLIKPPRSSNWQPGAVEGTMQLDEVAATLMDYAAVPAAGVLGRDRSRRRLLEGHEIDASCDSGVAVSMQGLAACLYRPPFKLVRFHEDDVPWPWLPKDIAIQRGATALFRVEPEADETQDVSASHPEVVAEMAADLERLAPLHAFVQQPLEQIMVETGLGDAAADLPLEGQPQTLRPLHEDDLPDQMTSSEVARLVALEVHQATLERELRDSEDRRSAAEQLQRTDAARVRDLRREIQRLRKDSKQLARWLEQIGVGVAKLYNTRRWRFGAWLRHLRKGRDARAGFPAVDTILERFAAWREGTLLQGAQGKGSEPTETTHGRWLRAKRPDEHRQRAMEVELDGLKARPVFGLVMAVPSHATVSGMCDAVRSVLAQSYRGWRLWLSGANANLRNALPQDPRIGVLERPSLPDGATHLAAMGAEDLLEPHTLMELALHIGKQPVSPHLVYTDEDQIDAGGVPRDPFFKPAWSPDTLESCNYVGALAVYECEFLQSLGADASWFTPDRAYDTALRAAEQSRLRVERLPRLLCHRRTLPEPVRKSLLETERQALGSALERRGDVAEVRHVPATGMFRVLRPVWKQEKVVILIPTRDRLALLRRAVGSLEEKTAYSNYEIVIINNDSRDPETLAWLSRCGHRVLDFPGVFNYAAMHNAAVRATDAPWLLFLNNDTEVIEPGWLTAMAEHVQRPEIGAVGAKLLFPDGTVQHAGVVLGIQQRAAHAFANLRPDETSARGQLQMVRNYSAVTAACMMMRREVYDQVGGMDADRFAVAYNDVELCVRVLRHGYRNLVTPYAVLKHHECASRPRRDHLHEVQHLKRACFGPDGWTDPFYHPALNQRAADFSVPEWF